MFGFSFDEQGGMICGVFREFQENAGELNCWNVATGSPVASPPTRIPGRFSVGGMRVAVSDYKPPIISEKMAILLDIGTPDPRFKDRLIWDYKSQRTVARWVPRKQKLAVDTQKFDTVRDAFAVSPSGQLYAEGGSGVVSLYRID
jgi:hypothetical protein